MKPIRQFRAFKLLLLFALMAFIIPTQAQDNDEVEITITKKSIDENGDEKIETITKKGKRSEIVIEDILGDLEDIDLDLDLEDLKEDMKELKQDVHIFMDDLPESLELEESMLELRESLKNLPVELEENFFEIETEVSEELENLRKTSKEWKLARVQHDPNKPFLGIVMAGTIEVSDDNGVREEKKIVEITKIVPNTAAEKAGLKKGDVLKKIGSQEITEIGNVSTALKASEIGETVPVTVLRDGQLITVNAQLTARPANTWSRRVPEMKIWKHYDNACSDKNFCEELEKMRSKPFLGVYLETGENDLEITRVIENTAADNAGIEAGDKIQKLGGKDVNDYEALITELKKYEPGDRVKVVYESNGKKQRAIVTLQSLADSKVNKAEWLQKMCDEAEEREEEIAAPEREEPEVETELRSAPGITEVEIYPNPTQGQITVRFQGQPGPTTITVLNITGQEVIRQELTSFDGNYQNKIDLGRYPKGTYFVNIMQGEKVFSEKIILE